MCPGQTLVVTAFVTKPRFVPVCLRRSPLTYNTAPRSCVLYSPTPSAASPYSAIVIHPIYPGSQQRSPLLTASVTSLKEHVLYRFSLKPSPTLHTGEITPSPEMALHLSLPCLRHWWVPFYFRLLSICLCVLYSGAHVAPSDRSPDASTWYMLNHLSRGSYWECYPVF